MPELGILRPGGVQAPTFQANPATFINPEALYSVTPKPIPSTAPLAKAALISSISQGLGNLPSTLLSSYNIGYNIGKAQAATSNPDAVTSYNSDGSFTTRPLSALDLTNLKVANEGLAWERYLHESDPYNLWLRKNGGSGYASPGKPSSPSSVPSESSMEPALPANPETPGALSSQPSLDATIQGNGSATPAAVQTKPLSGVDISAPDTSAPTPAGPLSKVDVTTPAATAAQVPTTGAAPTANSAPDSATTPTVPALAPETASTGVPQPVKLPAQQITPGGLILRDPAFPGMMQVLRPGQKPEFVKDPAQFDGTVFNSVQDLRAYADANGITYAKISPVPGSGKVVAQGISITPKLPKALEDRAGRLNIDTTGMTPSQVLAAVTREEDRRSVLDPEHEKALEGIEKDMRGDKQLQQAYNALDGLRKVNAVAQGQPMNLAQAKEVLTGFANIENGAQTLGPKMASFFENGQTLKSKLAQWGNNIANLLGQPGSSDQNMLDPKTLQDMQTVAKQLAGERAQQVTIPALNQYYSRAKRQGIPTQYIDESMSRYDTLKGDQATPASAPAAKSALPAGGGASKDTAYIINSQEQYDQIPAGAWYQDSNGKYGRKPAGSVAASGS